MHERRLAQAARSGARGRRGAHAASWAENAETSITPVRQAGANVLVVEDGEEPGPAGPPLGDQLDHRVAILGVQRGGRLVEDEQRMVAGEAARDVDPLLLAAGERRRRQRP